ALAGLGGLGRRRFRSALNRTGGAAVGHLQRQQAAAGEGELAAAAGSSRCRVRRRSGRGLHLTGWRHGAEPAYLAGLGLLLLVLHLPLEVVVIDAHIFALGAIHLVSYRPAAGAGLTPIG